ncbi:MAG: peptidoglycan glycosyltransferase [Cyclobacteriaceae bacterium]
MMSSRSLIIQAVILLIALIFSIRLFSIQVLNDDYKLAAQNNIVQKIIEYPYRGLITDRNDRLMVYNTPVYDLMIVPKEVNIEDSVEICRLFDIDQKTFTTKYKKAKRYSTILASKFIEQIPNENFAAFQDKLINFPGFYVLPRTIREYPDTTMANALGYLRQVSRSQLIRDTSNYYRSGDYIGLNGIEEQYENVLRGKRGIKYQLVNVQGIVKGSFNDGEYDTATIPGQSIKLTIDAEIQRYAEKLMQGKVGSIVAIEPASGEILSYVSAPSYDPNLLSGRDIGKNFQVLLTDSLKPLFNRPIQAMYPPGSMFKTIQTLIAMQEGLLGPKEKILCDYSPMGDHAPKGIYDVKKAIALSSNTFLYKVFRRVILQNQDASMFIDSRYGLEKWNNYAYNFGMGKKLGVDLPGEKSGNVPTVQYYDKVYGKNRWKFSNIYSLSIGQGELLVTPLQMANLGALLANQGYYYSPHIVKSINDESEIIPERKESGIESKYFESIIEGMEATVTSGTGFRARVQGLDICGKTSTVENPHGEDHSGFVAFAPKGNPTIAIAVYVENAGQGARAAAAIAGLIIEQYIKGEITRPWMEKYVLKGDFSDPVRKPKVELNNAVADTTKIDEGEPTRL